MSIPPSESWSPRLGTLVIAFSLAASACSGTEPLDAASQLDASPVPTSSSTTVVEAQPASSTTTTIAPGKLCGAGAETKGLVVPNSWDVGETRHLIVEISKEDSANPQPGGASLTPVTVTALEVDESGVLLEWLAAETDLSALGVDPTAAGPLGSMFDEFPRERLEYRIDSDGVFAGLENIEEVRENAITSIELLTNATQVDPTSPEGQSMSQAARILEGMDANALTNTFAQRTIAFHAFDGMSLDEGQRIEGPEVLENAFGGAPFPATTSIAHSPERDMEGCEVVTIHTVPDPETFTSILMETLGDTFDVSASEGEIDEIAEQFAIATTATMQLDPATGKVRSVLAVKDISAAGRQRLDTTVITVVDQ